MGGAAPDLTICRNCSAPLEGPFCARCGQKATPLNPTLRGLARDAALELLDFDGRIFRTVRLLLARPGFLTREHLAGRRARYVSPIRLYLVFSVAFFAAGAFYNSTKEGGLVSDQDIVESRPSLPGSASELTPDQIRERLEGAQRDWVPRVMFFLLPIAALVVWMVVPRAGLHYPQHFYFALHLHAAYFAADAMASLIYSTGIGLLSLAAALGQLAFIGWYVPAAFRTVYGGGWLVSALRAVVVAVVYLAAVSGVLLAVWYSLLALGVLD
jgi:hypothetical protein